MEINNKIYSMSFAIIYTLYINKTMKKGAQKINGL